MSYFLHMRSSKMPMSDAYKSTSVASTLQTSAASRTCESSSGLSNIHYEGNLICKSEWVCGCVNPTPQSPIGSECVDVKGEISHATLNTMIKFARLLLFHIGCINMIFQSKVQRSVTNNFSISEGPRISITITVQSKVHRSLTNNFSNSEAPRISS